MRYLVRWSAVTLILLLCNSLFIHQDRLLAADEDRINDKLDVEKERYESAIDDAKQLLIAAINNRIKEVAATGDFDTTKELRKQLEDCERRTKLPTDPALDIAAAAFSRATESAKNNLNAAYTAAVADYTRTMDLDAAERIEAERKRFMGETAFPRAAKPAGPKAKPTRSESRQFHPRGVSYTTWQDVKGLDLLPHQVPSAVKATSTHPGDWGPELAADGDRRTEFAFFGQQGDLVIDYQQGVKCSGVLLESRSSQDSVIRGVVRINDDLEVPIADFDTSRVMRISFGRVVVVRRIHLRSVQGHNNPGVSEVMFVR